VNVRVERQTDEGPEETTSSNFEFRIANFRI
jgi:hypothetical protein